MKSATLLNTNFASCLATDEDKPGTFEIVTPEISEIEMVFAVRTFTVAVSVLSAL